MKNTIKFLLSILLLIFLFSCSEDSETNDHSFGASKIIIFNNTEYDVKAVYITQGNEAPSHSDLGIKLNLTNNVLKYQESIEYCPTDTGNYHFTFVRQNGSTDNDLYISSTEALSIGDWDGLITLQLLPYNFYYTSVKNENETCLMSNDGE